MDGTLQHYLILQVFDTGGTWGKETPDNDYDSPAFLY